MKPLGLRLRIFLAMMAVISGFLALTSWVMDGLVDRFLDAEIANSLARGEKAHASFSSVRNAVLLDQARSVAQVPHLRAVLDTPDVDVSTVEYTLSTLSEAVGSSLLFVTDSRARMLADTLSDSAREVTIFKEPGVEQALLGEESCGIWDYAGEPYLVALSPVVLDTTVLGLLGIGYPLAQHADDLHGVTGLDVSIVRDGRILASARDARPEHSRPNIQPGSDAGAWSAVPAGQPSRLAIDGREYMATALALEPANVHVILSRPLDEVLSHFQNAKTEIILSGLAVVAVALLVSQWIARRIARPIRELTDAANTLAGGDLSAVVRAGAQDEIGALGRAFNAMARQLEALMQKALQKARAAEQANEAKSVFLATMSHELRTPLNGVLGFADQLLESRLDPEQRDHALFVRRSGEELLGIIDDVLDFAKIGAGKLKLEEAELHLPTCLKHAIDPVLPMIETKGLALSIAVAPNVPASLFGPASRVRQIVRNFVGNAAKFTSRGTIAVRGSLVSDSPESAVVRVEVEDSGPGIPPDRLGRLFKPFTQLDSGANREHGGTGLGLAICKELAEMLGGEVGVRSELGKGSVFWFTARLVKRPRPVEAEPRPAAALPLAPAAEPELAPPPSSNSLDSDAPLPSIAPAHTQSRGKQRILVAEDNVVNQKVTGAILKKAGWTHAFASNGREAVDLALAEPFDLILMDCQMPTMDGLEATRLIRDSERGTERHIAIVALTANAFGADREACLATGMDDFLAKPVKSADLVAVLDRWLTSTAEH